MLSRDPSRGTFFADRMPMPGRRPASLCRRVSAVLCRRHFRPRRVDRRAGEAAAGRIHWLICACLSRPQTAGRGTHPASITRRETVQTAIAPPLGCHYGAPRPVTHGLVNKGKSAAVLKPASVGGLGFVWLASQVGRRDCGGGSGSTLRVKEVEPGSSFGSSDWSGCKRSVWPIDGRLSIQWQPPHEDRFR